MVTACLIATTLNWCKEQSDQANGTADGENESDGELSQYDSIDGPSEEEAYLQGESCVSRVLGPPPITDNAVSGEYKTILQLVGVLSHGKLAKRLTDRAIDAMQDVQNLRKAIYEYVLGSIWSLDVF